MTPLVLFGQAPLVRAASPEETAAHDDLSAELSCYKLGRVTNDDADGGHRRMCPALVGKVRCLRREDSMSLPLSRPEVLSQPEHPPACCTQRTVTVPVAAFCARREDDERSQRVGLSPRTRRRRRTTLSDLVGASP